MRVVVGAGSCGLAAGADSLVQELKTRDLGSDTVLEITGCVGMCYLEPIVDIFDDCGQLHRFTHVKVKDLDAILEKFDEEACNQFRISEDDERILGKQVRIALRN